MVISHGAISSHIPQPTNRMGMPIFAVAASMEWNKLPQAIKTMESITGFRKQLKTCLFRLIYIWTLTSF